MTTAMLAIQVQTSVSTSGLAGFGFVAFLLVGATALVHVVCAVMVFRDIAAPAEGHRPRVQPILLPGTIWALGVGLLGIAGLGIYWAVHYSSLNPRRLAETLGGDGAAESDA